MSDGYDYDDDDACECANCGGEGFTDDEEFGE